MSTTTQSPHPAKDVRPEVLDLLRRTRIDRGLSPTIEDPAVLAKVARIIGGGDRR